MGLRADRARLKHEVRRANLSGFSKLRLGQVAAFFAFSELTRLHHRWLAVEHIYRLEAVANHANGAIEHARQMAACAWEREIHGFGSRLGTVLKDKTVRSLKGCGWMRTWLFHHLHW